MYYCNRYLDPRCEEHIWIHFPTGSGITQEPLTLLKKPFQKNFGNLTEQKRVLGQGL